MRDDPDKRSVVVVKLREFFKRRMALNDRSAVTVETGITIRITMRLYMFGYGSGVDFLN